MSAKTAHRISVKGRIDRLSVQQKHSPPASPALMFPSI
jgi:hypothetical protein